MCWKLSPFKGLSASLMGLFCLFKPAVRVGGVGKTGSAVQLKPTLYPRELVNWMEWYIWNLDFSFFQYKSWVIFPSLWCSEHRGEYHFDESSQLCPMQVQRLPVPLTPCLVTALRKPPCKDMFTHTEANSFLQVTGSLEILLWELSPRNLVS